MRIDPDKIRADSKVVKNEFGSGQASLGPRPFPLTFPRPQRAVRREGGLPSTWAGLLFRGIQVVAQFSQEQGRIYRYTYSSSSTVQSDTGQDICTDTLSPVVAQFSQILFRIFVQRHLAQ